MVDKKKADIVETDAEILEVLPNGICKVKLENGNVITAYLKGIFKEKKIKVYPKDKVKVELSIYDTSMEKGRISFKYRNEQFGDRDPNAKRSVSSRKIRNRRH
jgi:translation initiation factor IF-1